MDTSTPTFVAPTLLALLIACGDDGAAPPVDASADAPIDAPISAIEGRWSGACPPRPGPPTTEASRWGVEYSANRYTATQSYHLTTGCSVGDLALVLTEQGAFTIGGPGAVAGSTNIDHVQGAITARTFNGYAATINGARTCSGVIFVDGSDVSLSGATCAGAPVPTNGSTLLGLYRLDTAATPDTLTLGATNGIGQVGSATRPTVLSNDVMQRQ